LAKEKKKPYISTVLFGIVAVALYTALLTNQDTVNTYFTKGGLYAFLPIAVAFLLSFVHGTFTGNFWTLLGVEAAKKHKEAK
jgi:uncharacterized integral membrane protein